MGTYIYVYYLSFTIIYDYKYINKSRNDAILPNGHCYITLINVAKRIYNEMYICMNDHNLITLSALCNNHVI